MSAYRYVVFPRGKQPTADEVRELQGFAGLLVNHFAWGVVRHDGRLALACEQAAFDHARQVDAGFDALVRKWEVRGCELVEHLGFVKDATALRPSRAHAQSSHVRPTDEQRLGDSPPSGDRPRGGATRPDEAAAAKRMVDHEAVARSLLSVERTLERYAVVQRFAAAFPYLLMVVAAAATIGVGLYIRDRVLNSGRERRQEAIERVLNDSEADAHEDKSIR